MFPKLGGEKEIPNIPNIEQRGGELIKKGNQGKEKDIQKGQIN